MRKIILFITLIFSTNTFAILNLELTRGVAGAVPIAIVPFAGSESLPQDVSMIVRNDLQNSGRFKVYGRESLKVFPSSVNDVQFNYFHNLGADNIVIGKITAAGGGRYKISFQLLDAARGKNTQSPAQALMLNHSYEVSAEQLRSVAHHISDLVYEQILGIKGVFSTRLAYVLVQRSPKQTRYILEVSDQDGYNPRPLLTSIDPIMSPAWSPNGKQIAYVSFENRRASIYVEDVATGARRMVSQFNGINGAPAWSPDGRKLALVLSKDGAPNIYSLDLISKRLTQLTRDWAINTEPAWSPDGKSIIFTSTRGGGPQIYQMNLGSRNISRLSYDGDYNARASFTADGNHIAMLHRENGVFNIGLLDLNGGSFHLLTNTSTDNESPSVAPNGSMVLYGALHNGKSILSMVSSDGRVQLRLPARDGEVQDPDWSPFLS